MAHSQILTTTNWQTNCDLRLWMVLEMALASAQEPQTPTAAKQGKNIKEIKIHLIWITSCHPSNVIQKSSILTISKMYNKWARTDQLNSEKTSKTSISLALLNKVLSTPLTPLIFRILMLLIQKKNSICTPVRTSTSTSKRTSNWLTGRVAYPVFTASQSSEIKRVNQHTDTITKK